MGGSKGTGWSVTKAISVSKPFYTWTTWTTVLRALVVLQFFLGPRIGEPLTAWIVFAGVTFFSLFTVVRRWLYFRGFICICDPFESADDETMDEESNCSTVRNHQLKFDDVFQDEEENLQFDKVQDDNSNSDQLSSSPPLWNYSKTHLNELLATKGTSNMNEDASDGDSSHENDTLFSSPTLWFAPKAVMNKEVESQDIETEAETEGDESTAALRLVQSPIEIQEVFDYEDDDDRPTFQRLLFLENLKIALIFIVVSHHVTCAFGGYGSYWGFVVGLYDNNTFLKVASSIAILNQGYFMPLFFFIYAYVTPIVYDRKGAYDFLFDNAKRYWIPLLFMTFVVYPLLIMYCQWFSGAELFYIPTFGHTWFLMWVLALTVVYTHVRESYSQDQSQGPGSRVALPSANARCFYGFVICGCGMLGIIFLLRDNMFAAMPISIGSLVNNLFMFVAGIVAGKNQWLEKRLRKQLDVCITEMRLMLLVEAAMMVWFLLKFLETEKLWFVIFGVCISGMYCVDMSLVILDLFQTSFNFQTPLSRALADAAYTVYLIHPVAVTGFMSLWIHIYEAMGYGKIEFEGQFHSSTPIKGDGWTLALSWFLVNLACHIVLWPLAWKIRRLPILREIL